MNEPKFPVGQLVMFTMTRQVGTVVDVEYLPVSHLHRYKVRVESDNKAVKLDLYAVEENLIAADQPQDNVEVAALKEMIIRVRENNKIIWSAGVSPNLLKLAKRMRVQGFSFNEIEDLLTAVYWEIVDDWNGYEE